MQPALPTFDKRSNWLNSFIQFAPLLTFLVWIFQSGFRRIFDWQSSFHAISIFSIAIFVVIIPGMFLLRGRVALLGGLFGQILLLWIFAFAYSYLVGIMNGQYIAGIYAGALYFTPIGLAGYLIANRYGFFGAYKTALDSLFWCTFVAAVYGVYQYVSPPAWDIYWLNSTHIVSMGTPEPFGLRIFGPAGSAGGLGEILAFTLIVILPRIRFKDWYRIAAVMVVILALILTLVRTCWIQLTLGIIVYLLLSPKRKNISLTLAFLILTIPTFLGAFSSLQGSHASNILDSITTRVLTFNDLSEDASYTARQQVFENGLKQVTQEPLGQGLGSVGTAAKLGDTQDTADFDNGYLARLAEMGLLGGIVFISSIAIATIRSVMIYLSLRGNPEKQSYAAAAIALQAVLIFGQIGADSYSGFGGLYFWLEIALISSLQLVDRGFSGGSMSSSQTAEN